jgi:predicted Zn-dependent protease
VATARPDLSYGYVLAAFAWWMGAANRWAPDAEAALETSNELARKGVQVVDATGLGKAVQAAVAMSRGRADVAIEHLEGLGNVRPTCDITFGLEGSVRRYLGEWERSVELLDKAMRLTGITNPWYPTVKASALFLGGQLEDSASIAEQVLEHQPKNLEALVVLAAAQSELGLHRRARATLSKLRERFPHVDVQQWLNDTPYHSREVVGRWKQALEASSID